MNASTEKHEDAPYQCPVCGAGLAIAPPVPPHDALCPACKCSLWCRKRMVGKIVVLDVLRGRTPKHEDVERLTESLVCLDGVPNVVIDLSDLDFVNSSFMARLIAFYKRIGTANGKLILRGLQHPSVRGVFSHIRLDSVFDISDDEDTALASF